MSSKRYAAEFKIEAVKQVMERGHSAAEVAADAHGRFTSNTKCLPISDQTPK